MTKGSLRLRILAVVGALVSLSLLGSSMSLYRITEVNRSLDAINEVSIPLGRLFVQLQADADIYRREMERRLGNSHWSESGWKPRPIPRWIEDLIENEIKRAGELIHRDLPWTDLPTRQNWKTWESKLMQGLQSLQLEANTLYRALEQRNLETASQIYPRWMASLESWSRQIQWGVNEYERSQRQAFGGAQSQVAQLRTGLEMILVVVVLLSLLLLWLGERALRPLGELTLLAREIARRGLRKEDKASLPDLGLNRKDEVSQLAREFHRMATALLEREKIVESQKHRLQEQNRLLREMGELNKNILDSIESILIVADLQGHITQCNPVAAAWLGQEPEKIIGSELSHWPVFEAFPGSKDWLTRVSQSVEGFRIDSTPVGSKVFGGHVLPLKRETEDAHGAILVLEDLTEALSLQDRLQTAEKLAAVGRMSAQVAHEVRNPLHSIGLEAELAAEMAGKLGHIPLKQALQSILGCVDRLEKVTENYLKLSRLTSGKKTWVDLGEVLESVLATYAPLFESQSVRVDWSHLSNSSHLIWGDRDLLEHVLGNLLRNSLQALDTSGDMLARLPKILFTLGTNHEGQVTLLIEDNGRGIPPEMRPKLFTPFATDRAEGTGLGLSFVKKVLEDHGGQVICHDREPGTGACFEIKFPASQQNFSADPTRAGVFLQEESVNV